MMPGPPARGDDRQRTGERHQPAQSAQLAHVTGAGLVVDDAGGHEQRGLEGGVVEDVEHAGDHRHRRGQAEQQGDQAQVRDRRIGQQALQVVLEDRVPGAAQQGQCADAAARVEEQVAAGQRRVQARQQEHAGLHHGGRVQVGRDRGRCRHRVRQPEVERELRTLGEDAGQHQEQRVRVQRAGADLLAGSQYHVQVEAADDAADQQHATEQGQATAAAGTS
ncbi:hypothetical protein G6F35_014026 [Rhizopus arrhizus]|nr:hypothetical protein G6F35_014026 [Rhizopus arrhizus]